MNVCVVGKGLELLSADGCRFEIKMLLFEDDTALPKQNFSSDLQ